MKNLKKLTILHSNDMHGDFLEEEIDEKLVGGVSLLSGYVNKVRREERNVIYAVAGDMFRGSVIDSEYKGTSTIGIMNLVGPDVATIGNHEVDYGLAHLLFLEKCADFPIINANLHIKSNGRRMFRPYWIAKLDGEPLHADRLYTVAMQKYHYTNLKPFLDITLEEAEENGKTSVLSTSARDVVEEYITVNQHLAREVEGRLVVEA
jgi:5'-nucleotidase/UDP-sugar diphosphatase